MHTDSTPNGQGAFRIPAGLDHALLIHGYMGSPREFLPLAMALADAGVTAQAVLLPGFGDDRERLGSVRAEDWLQAARTMWQEMRRSSGRSTSGIRRRSPSTVRRIRCIGTPRASSASAARMPSRSSKAKAACASRPALGRTKAVRSQ